MRSIKRDKKKTTLIAQDTLKDSVYATINGVLQPIVYDATEVNQITKKSNVYLTPEARLAKRKAASNTKAISTVQEIDGETATVVNPEFVFDYSKGYAEVTSGNNIQTWLASFSNNQLTQANSSFRPDVGLDGRGINGVSPAYFKYDNTDHLVFSSGITLTGDFTIFMYVEPIPLIPNIHKYHRFLGKSDDNDMYFSIGESGNTSYTLSFSSSSRVQVSITPEYWQPSSKKILITLQRSGTTLYIRENGVQVASETTPTTDFSFNQFGIRGGLTSDTYNGSLYHISAYNHYISTNLVDLENSIITQSSLAKG
jgi:hypothetical protein